MQNFEYSTPERKKKKNAQIILLKLWLNMR